MNDIEILKKALESGKAFVKILVVTLLIMIFIGVIRGLIGV